MGQTIVNEEIIFVLTTLAPAFTIVKCQADAQLLLQGSGNPNFRSA